MNILLQDRKRIIEGLTPRSTGGPAAFLIKLLWLAGPRSTGR